MEPRNKGEVYLSGIEVLKVSKNGIPTKVKIDGLEYALVQSDSGKLKQKI